MDSYQGACHCGRVRFALAGAPMMAAFLTRFRCADCGTPIYNAVRSERLTCNNFMLPLLGALDERTRPTCHLYYADRIVDMEDGLPKHDRFKWSPREAAPG